MQMMKLFLIASGETRKFYPTSLGNWVLSIVDAFALGLPRLSAVERVLMVMSHVSPREGKQGTIQKHLFGSEFVFLQ